MNDPGNFTVEETNLLGIYKTGSREELVAAMHTALPFMKEEMQRLAVRTLARVEKMSDAEFAELSFFCADEA